MEKWNDYGSARLQTITEYEDNWDMEGAIPVTADALDMAGTLVQTLDYLNVPRPFICASQDGGVEFEWSGGTTEVNIHITRNVVEFMLRNPTTGQCWEGMALDVIADLMGIDRVDA